MSRRPDSRDLAGRTEAGEGGPATCTRGSKARTYRQGSKPSAVVPDAGVVLVENYSWKQTRRGNPLLVVRERDSQAREYSFSGSYTRPNASVIKYYVCLACRKKKEKRCLRSTELPRMKVLGSGEVYDMRNALHLCKPLTSSQVTGKHYERDQRLSLLNCSALCPKEVYEVVQNNFKKELSLCPVEEREDIQQRLPSYKSVKALYYRKIRPGGVRGLRFSAAMQSEQASAEMEPNTASSLAAESILQAAVPSVPRSSASSEEDLRATSCVPKPAGEGEDLQATSCTAKSALEEEEEGLQATSCVAKPAVKEERLEATSCVERAVEAEAVDTPRASAASGKAGGKPKSFFGVPVRRFFWKHTQNGNPLLVVKEGGASAREYTFSSKYGRPGLPPVRYYVCLGCRREREGKALPGRPLPRIKVLEDGRVFDMVTAPHLCSPLTMAQVAGKHFERDHRLSLPNCSARRAKEAYEAMRANLSEQLSEHREEERQDIERCLPSFKSVRSMYYRKMRQSGKRWVPYGELQPLVPRAGLEPATDTPGEAPVVSTTDEPFISDVFNTECPEPNAFKDLVLGAAYSLAPECVLEVAEQDLQCEPDKLDVSISNPSTSESMSQDLPRCGSDELKVNSELVQAAVQDSLHCESDKSGPSSAYPLAPTCMWKVEAQDPSQYRLQEGATDDAELVADDAVEVDASQEARAAGHCDSQEKQKPPNGVSVREFFWKQTLRGNPLLMVKGEDSTVREYIFNSKYGRPGAPLVKYYVCLGCRKEREAKALPGGPLARMKVLEDGRVFDMSNTPHFCTPLSMAQVAGKHFERDHRLSLPNCGARRAKDAYEEMRVKLADFLNEHPAEEREDIERSLPSFKSMRSMYYRRLRESGRRWAPYSEPTKQVPGAETEPASEESCREPSDFSRTCEPCFKEAATGARHGAGTPDKQDQIGAHPPSPEHTLAAAALDPLWREAPEESRDDPMSAAEEATERELRQEEGTADPANREERRQKPPNGVLVWDFFWQQTLRGNPLLVVKGENGLAREFCFSSKYGRPGAPPVKYYVCQGCRKERETNALPGVPLPRMKVLGDGKVFDMRNAPHLCSPLTMAQVVGKHFERDHRLSLPNCGARRAREAYEAMRANLTDFLNEHPAEEREDIERSLPSFKRVRSMYHRRMRGSSRRWAPYSEPTKPVFGTETELASQESSREQSDSSRVCEPYVEEAVAGERQEVSTTDGPDLSSAYPSLPGYWPPAAALNSPQREAPEKARDDLTSAAEDAVEAESRQGEGVADRCDREEQRLKPPNGVPVRDVFWRQTLRGNPLLVVKEEDGSAREYCFSSKYGRDGAPLVKYYVCRGCRKEREINALPSQPLPRMKVLEDGKVFDMRNAPHLCSSLTMAQVVGKHLEREHRLSLPNSGARQPKEAYEALKAKLAMEMSALPEAERREVERFLPSFKSVRSLYHRKMRQRAKQTMSSSNEVPPSESKCASGAAPTLDFFG